MESATGDNFTKNVMEEIFKKQTKSITIDEIAESEQRSAMLNLRKFLHTYLTP